MVYVLVSGSWWPPGLRRMSAGFRLLRLWVRIPPGAWMFVCCECFMLSGRGLCDELITRPEESYRMWCVVVRDIESSWMRWPRPTWGCRAKNKNIGPSLKNDEVYHDLTSAAVETVEFGFISINARFQVSAAMYMDTAFSWAITQRVVVIIYRRFGTNYRPHLQTSRIQEDP